MTSPLTIFGFFVTNIFHFAVGRTVIHVQMTSKCGINISDTLGCGHKRQHISDWRVRSCNTSKRM